MDAATILQSDTLDIIFENRNKQYGAYTLRKEYNTRLYRSLALVMGIVAVLMAENYFSFNPPPKGNGILAASGVDSVQFIPVDIPKDPLPPPVTPPPSASHLPAINNTVPVIVPNNAVADTLPTVDQLQDNVISDKTSPGDGPVNDNSTAGDDHSKGNGPATAPVAEPATPEPAIADHPDVMPEFPGGLAALLRFLGKNLQVPEEAVEAGQRVRVPVKFVVSKEGSLTDVEFPAQTDNLFKKEIMRVISKMPRWKPGVQHGKLWPCTIQFP